MIRHSKSLWLRAYCPNIYTVIIGRPAVHPDDDLIVSHIAITVSNMEELKKRLKDLNVLSRKNVSVPNPSDTDTGTVDQVKSYLENGILF